MACEQFRFLIQQQFDFELPPQDETQLSAHLSQCEACERFHFQMDQIVRTAADLDLPDDTTPENLESLARIVIQQLPKPKGGPLSFITNLFGNKKAAPKEQPKASHTPKGSSRFPHVRRNQSATNENAIADEGPDEHSPPIEDHSQSISTTLSGRFGRGGPSEAAEPEGPLTLADTIRRKVQEEKQTVSPVDNANVEPPPPTAWPSADANLPPMPQGQAESFPPSNFQEDNAYSPAGGAWEEPAWSQTQNPPSAPPEQSSPNPLASIDLMGQTSDAHPSAWSNSIPTSPSAPSAPSDLEKGLWQAQQSQPIDQPDSQKAWSDEAEQLQTGFWQAFTSEQDSGLSGPGGQTPAAHAAQPSPPQPMSPPPAPLEPTLMQPPPPPTPMAMPPLPPAAPMAMPPAPSAPMAAPTAPNMQPAAKQEDVVISRFDIPIQERMSASQPPAPPPIPAPSAPPVPDTVWPTPAAPMASEPANEPKSIISRLSSILGDSPGQASTPQLMSDDNDSRPVDMSMATESPSPSAPIPLQAPSAQVVPSPPPAPVPVPAAASQAQPAAQAQAANPSGLFNVDERTIDKIFSENLGIVDAGTAVNPGQPAQVINQAVQAPSAPANPAPTFPQPPMPPQQIATPPSAPPSPAIPPPVQQSPAPPVQPAPPAAKPAQHGLFADMDDAAIDQLFSSNLGISEPITATQPQLNQPVNPPAIPQPIPAAPPLPPPVPQMVPPPPEPVQSHIATPPPAAPEPAAEIAQPMIPPPIPVEPSPVATQPAANVPIPELPPIAPEPAEVPVAMASPAPQSPPQKSAQGDGILSVSESDLDKLFSENLGVSESALSAAPKVNLTQAVETIRQATTSSQAPPPKIEGVGRLSKNVDTSQDTSSGKISSIGKFLLDQKDLAKLGKVASSNLTSTDMRVLTMEAAQELQNLLGHIGSQPGVAGSVIVGHDGILIANNLPPGHDAESVGVWALGIFLNTENTIKMLGHNHVFQMVARTPQGFLVIADFGGGILVTVSQSSQTNELIPLMRTITQLVAQTAH